MTDNDELDGCDLDFAENPDDELTASLRELFPQGLQTEDLDKLAEDWKILGALDV